MLSLPFYSPQIITPVVYTAISDLSPVGMKSTMMGCWLLFIALGGYLSSVLASASHLITRIPFFKQSGYFGEFIFIVCFMLIVIFVLLISIPRLSRMMD